MVKWWWLVVINGMTHGGVINHGWDIPHGHPYLFHCWPCCCGLPIFVAQKRMESANHFLHSKIHSKKGRRDSLSFGFRWSIWSIWSISHRIHGAGIYASIWGILMVNVTIYGIHGSYGYATTNPSISQKSPWLHGHRPATAATVLVPGIFVWGFGIKQIVTRGQLENHACQGPNVCLGHLDKGWQRTAEIRNFHSAKAYARNKSSVLILK